MNTRNKILTQILLVSNQYNLEIIAIEFKNVYLSLQQVNVIIKIDNYNFIISYDYSKDNIIEVNGFLRYFNNELNEILLKEE